MAAEKIDYLEFPARDLAATQTFFTQVFGWTFKAYGEDYTSFNSPGMRGGFYRADQASTIANGAALVVLYSSDLQAIQAKIQAAGGRITREIFSFPGGRRFHFTEPSGNELAVWSDR